eukprot:439053-Amorphochlora_amoeboformis.AAC.1
MSPCGVYSARMPYAWQAGRQRANSEKEREDHDGYNGSCGVKPPGGPELHREGRTGLWARPKAPLLSGP